MLLLLNLYLIKKINKIISTATKVKIGLKIKLNIIINETVNNSDKIKIVASKEVFI